MSSFWETSDALTQVRTGAADAVLLDRATALERVDAAGLQLQSLGERERFGYRLALGRANRDLALAVDEALSGLRRDGTLQQIEQRWFPQSTG